MILDRELIFSTFWSRVSGIAEFVTKSRRLRHWDDTPNQPALFMVQHTQNPAQKLGLPPIWTFNLLLFVYDNVGNDETAIPGQRLNVLVDLIDRALAPTLGQEAQTLGGLVNHCWISGPVETYEGYAAMLNQSVAVIPVQITVPNDSGAY